ncbi:venom serine carboxypeptidase-like [Lycorma delicatula]|uniref:venom serine carboxypeptidase-like n=1 Tax=Lycorma delicatula TaxID=130591 RepID=UPI003F50F54B
MTMSVVLIILSLSLININIVLCSDKSLHNFIDNDDQFNNVNDGNRNDGPGTPLFLTPLIESGKIEEAKKKATVKPFLKSIHSYSGYLTVNKEFNSNIFFWFFKSEQNWQKSPVTVWLQGGPGASSLFGLFVENGPYILENKKLHKRYHSWHKNSNIIFIDNPVGTGFSFTESDDGYVKNQTIIGEQLYNAIKQFFSLFPVLKNNEFFITGESYAGKYVPALGYTIHKYNLLENNDFKINLKGLLIGNGLTDPVNMLKYGDYIYELGLVDFNDLRVFHDYEKKITDNIKRQNWSEATDLFGKLILGYHYYPEGSLFGNLTGIKEHYNYVDEKSGKWTNDHINFVNSDLFRRSVHVGNKTYNKSQKVALILKEDILKSVISWVIELLDHYRIVFYNGQLDIICAYPLTENFLKNMKWKGSHEYSNAKRQIWNVGNNVAGYFKIAGNLTEVLVRNAGHLVPTDQPLSGHVLFNKFIFNANLSDSDYSL